jgi:hypothetical protein
LEATEAYKVARIDPRFGVKCVDVCRRHRLVQGLNRQACLREALDIRLKRPMNMGTQKWTIGHGGDFERALYHKFE